MIAAPTNVSIGIVDDSGRDSPKRYAVRERASTKYVSGGNPQPRNGKVVGHIINYEYVPVDTEIKSAPAVPDMLSFDGVLEGIDAQVVYKKVQIKGGRFLYAFKDARKAAKEEATYLANAKRKNTFSPEQYAKKKNLFGVIVLESDQDLEPIVAYTCYEDRWLLELVFKRYKSDECLDHTGEQGDYSVIGSEFVNFISTVATCRIIKKAEQAGLLKQMSYGDLMDDLSSAWRRTDAPKDPSTDDGYWAHTLNTVFEELEALGLFKPVPKTEPKKRGRKPKPKDQAEPKPKQPRGRPRKDVNQSAGNL